MYVQQKQKQFNQHKKEIDGNYKDVIYFNKTTGLAGEKYRKDRRI